MLNYLTPMQTSVYWQPKMSWGQFKRLVAQDLYRYAGSVDLLSFLRTWRWERGFRVTLLTRFCYFCLHHPLARRSIYYPSIVLQRRMCARYSVFLDASTEIGGGLYIPHALGIIVNRNCVIGRNCNLGHLVTLGVANRGERQGTPTIGNNAYIGVGAVVFGGIRVGHRAAIGANAVVARDVPDDAVVVGAPARVISYEGSRGYVNQILGDTAPP